MVNCYRQMDYDCDLYRISAGAASAVDEVVLSVLLVVVEAWDVVAAVDEMGLSVLVVVAATVVGVDFSVLLLVVVAGWDVVAAVDEMVFSFFLVAAVFGYVFSVFVVVAASSVGSFDLVDFSRSAVSCSGSVGCSCWENYLKFRPRHPRPSPRHRSQPNPLNPFLPPLLGSRLGSRL